MNVELWGHWLNKSWIGEKWMSASARAQVKFLMSPKFPNFAPDYPLGQKGQTLSSAYMHTERC
jgi:hypothetical protein